jgi:glycosyltransferase involved in cell wall biosynthesis
MRIGINALLMELPAKIGGMESYMRQVVSALAAFDKENDYLLFCHPKTRECFPSDTQNMQARIMQEKRLFVRIQRFLQFHTGATFATTELDRLIDELQLEMLFYPTTILFPPVRTRKPVVLSVADIQQEYFPEFFTSKELRMRNRHYRRSFERADVLLAISQYTKATLQERFHVEPGRIHVVYPPVEQTFIERPSPGVLSAVRLRYDLPQKFFIYPAATWKHKNHLRLIAAVALLKQKKLDLHLVLTGLSMDADVEIAGYIDELNVAKNVQRIGYIPREDLQALYALAHGMVFPSLFEGFGIPVAEALTSGLPVACSSTTSLPEVAEDAAIYFDPLNVEEIAHQLERLWLDEGLCETLRQRGRTVALRFRPDTIAPQLAAVFRGAA